MKPNNIFQCNFLIENKLQQPELLIIPKNRNYSYRPKPTFIISKDIKGEIISTYGDDKWELRPYCTTLTENHFLDFSSIHPGDKEDVKWLCTIMMYHSNNGVAGKITPSTLYAKYIRFKHLSSFARSKQGTLRGIFSSKSLLIKYINVFIKDDKKGPIKELMNILTKLIQIDSSFTGIKLIDFETYNLIKKESLSMINKKNNQHAVIPPRIYSNYLSELWKILQMFIDNSNQLSTLLLEITKYKGFGRRKGSQRYYGKKAGTFYLSFNDVILKFKLKKYLSHYNISSFRRFRTHIAMIQNTCRLLLLAYSGMRCSEVLSLKYNCLTKERLDDNIVVRLLGDTTKLVGAKKPTSWVTSIEVEKVVDVAQTFSHLANISLEMKESKLPLFLNTSYIFSGPKFVEKKFKSIVSRFSTETVSPHNKFESNKINITEADMLFLERVEPLRDWKKSKYFNIGQDWHLTSHQLRRSLAFYVSQSGMVTLSSLRRQLKHITKEMTLYYANGSGLENLFLKREHFKNKFVNTKTESSSIAYLFNLVLTNEKIYGPHGVTIERIKTEIIESQIIIKRDEILNDFKAGRIAYTETPLGACTTRELCHQKAMRSILSCISCKDAALVPSKIYNVIEKQEKLILRIQS